MNTPTTKTRALCVATRCTSVEQFVATFHRFCGDDETFFVATMTSRPIGLETPFSIQLADKQPVLRGLCIVLDAWATPENRFRRPGIRLGIKRLTADSQVIYDRLKAASRVPGSGLEVSSGPTPQPQLAPGSQPPGPMRRPATPPPLPPLLPPRTLTPPAVPAIARDATPPLVVRVPPLGAAAPTTAPRLSRGASTGSPPRGVAARPVPSVVPAEARPALPSVSGRTGTTRPGMPSIPLRGGASKPAPTAAEAKPAEAKPAEAKPAEAKPAEAKRAEAKPAESRPPVPPVPSVVPGVVPVDVKPAAPGGPARSGDTKPGMPSAVPAAAPPVVASPAQPAAPELPVRTGTTRPGMPSAVPAPPGASAGPAADPLPAPAAPAPIAVTRFQIALRVDSAPAPLTDVEFKPTELAPRKRFDRIIGELSSSEAQSDDALPAVILDRMSGPVPAEPLEPDDSDASVPSFAAYETTNRTVDPLADRRTPGSSLVLPANPLQDLSDESIEGFVDCTLYEETENIFHPSVDGPEWADVTAETPMHPGEWAPAPASPPRSIVAQSLAQTLARSPAQTVPVLPYDTPPELTVRAQDGTESLAVALDDPGAARLAAAAQPDPPRPSSGPLGVPSAEIIDDPPPDPPPRPPAVIVDDPALAQAAADELRARPAAADPESQSRTASGELWSETLRRTPAAGLPRLQPRPDTPLPRPATNVPMDLGQSADPASWFDSVSLPHSAAAPRPAMAMDAAVAPGGADPAPAMTHEHSVALPDAAAAPAVALASGVALDRSLLAGMPGGPAMPPPGLAVAGMPLAPLPPPGMPPGFGYGPGMPPVDPAMTGIPPGFGAVGPGGYAIDSAPYPRYSAEDLVALPGMPGARMQPAWQRWLLIAGSAVIAIILAFVMARMARGSDRAAPARPPIPPPAPAHVVEPPAPAHAAVPDGAAAGDGDPPGGASDGDPAAAAGAAPVVGSGPCRFTVASTPAGAAVRFDDQPMGPSPIIIQGSCDKHRVDLAHVRYQSVTRWVTLSADRPQELDISLPRPVHAVTVTSSPPGAELSIDGHRAGTTPTVVQVAGFATVNLTLTKPGFQSVTRKVYSKVAQDRVFVKLTK